MISHHIKKLQKEVVYGFYFLIIEKFIKINQICVKAEQGYSEENCTDVIFLPNSNALFRCVWRTESIEWLNGDRLYRGRRIWLHAHPVPPQRHYARPATHRKTEKERQLSDRGREGAWSWIIRPQESLFNHSILSAWLRSLVVSAPDCCKLGSPVEFHTICMEGMGILALVFTGP